MQCYYIYKKLIAPAFERFMLAGSDYTHTKVSRLHSSQRISRPLIPAWILKISKIKKIKKFQKKFKVFGIDFTVHATSNHGAKIWCLQYWINCTWHGKKFENLEKPSKAFFIYVHICQKLQKTFKVFLNFCFCYDSHSGGVLNLLAKKPSLLYKRLNLNRSSQRRRLY